MSTARKLNRGSAGVGPRAHSRSGSRRTSSVRRALLISAVAACVFTAFPAPSAAQDDLDGEQVRAAIRRSVASLKGRQAADGTWPDYARPGGVTALVTYALLRAGVAPDDASVARGLDALTAVPDEATYVVALKAMAYASAGLEPHRARLQGCVDWLAETQHASGGWGYGQPSSSERASVGNAGGWFRVRTEAQLQSVYGRADASNTQFALLGLAEAHRAGAHVPDEAWRRADRHFRNTQLPGGGWGYVYHDPDPEEAYGSMTAAGVASLRLCADRLAASDSADADGRLKRIDQALAWLDAHYTLDENPNRGRAWYYFWLYSLERAGVTSGRRAFGGHDWFREGAGMLVKGQRADGSWAGNTYQNALCLLFLVKGFKPLLVQRLMWEGPWQRDPRDLEHLARFLGTRVGGQHVSWQVVDESQSLSDYLAAPILHVTGRGPIRLLAGTLPRLRAYVEQGGLILFDALGGDAAFADSVRRLAGDIFAEATFEPLPSNHPIYVGVPPGGARDLEVLPIGCRASVLLAPKGLSDRWTRADPDRGDASLALGEGLAAYATGSQALPDRLEEARLLRMPVEVLPPGDALRIGQIQHGADWRPRPYALPSLLEDLSTQFGVAVYRRPMPASLSSPRLGTFSLLYMTGHHSFQLPEADRAALKGYLDRGGALLTEACCGRAAFDQSVRKLVAEMYPDGEFKELPTDHAIYAGKVGPKIERVRYSEAVRSESPGLDRPVLWGLERDGHLAIVHSPYGLSVGLDGIRTFGARALEPEDARRLGAAILLYLMTD